MKSIQGKVYGADTIPIDRNHPVSWLRGRTTIKIAGNVTGVRIGEDVVVVDMEIAKAAAFLAGLSRWSSWPDEVAQTVEAAAQRVIDAFAPESKP